MKTFRETASKPCLYAQRRSQIVSISGVTRYNFYILCFLHNHFQSVERLNQLVTFRQSDKLYPPSAQSKLCPPKEYLSSIRYTMCPHVCPGTSIHSTFMSYIKISDRFSKVPFCCLSLLLAIYRNLEKLFCALRP